MKTSKKKKQENIVYINTDCYYLIPLMPITNTLNDFTEELVEVKITLDDKRCICVHKDGYKDKYFADLSFEFLRDTGYIKIIK